MNDVRDGPNWKSSTIDSDGIWQISKGLALTIRVAGRSLDTCKLNSKGSPSFSLQLSRGSIKRHRPTVDIGVVGLQTYAVGLAAKDAPMYVVEIPRDVASANVKVHTIGEIIGEIVDRPV